MTSVPPPAYLDNHPRALGFGTSGLRGLVSDMTDLETYVNIKGALRYLRDRGELADKATVVLGGDLRPSTPRLMRAALRAAADLGFAVENAGMIPTPALVARAMHLRTAGIMVTGSHIPFDRNGIKINKPAGEILKADEAGIIAEVLRVRAEEYGRSHDSALVDAAGMLRQVPELPAVAPAALAAYRARYLDCFPRDALRGCRVLVYQHSAVGRDFLLDILRELGAEALPVGRSDTFIPIDTENVTTQQLQELRQFALDYPLSGRPADAIVSTDGDSDRPLVAAIVAGPADVAIEFLPGDLLGLVVAGYLDADAVAVPVSSNDAVERALTKHGVRLRKTRIGSPYVIEALEAWRAEGQHARIVGWEANGGFLTGSDMDLGGQRLPALPTRDALLPILACLAGAIEKRQSLVASWATLPARYGSAGLIDNFPTAVSQALLARFAPLDGALEVDFSPNGACTVSDASGNTGSPTSAASARIWQDRRAFLARAFASAGPSGDIVRLNVQDGVRITFANGDIAHIRPSGNAPQMRIYSNSDTAAGARAIVETALREPDGTLRRVEQMLIERMDAPVDAP